LNKNILFLGISIFLLGFVTSNIQLAEATNIASFTTGTVTELGGAAHCDPPTVSNLSVILGVYIMDPQCEYILTITATPVAQGPATFTLFDEEWFGFLAPQKLHTVTDSNPPISVPFDMRCDDDLTIEIAFAASPFEDTNERETELYVEDGTARAPGTDDVWVFRCSNVPYSQVIVRGTVDQVFDDGFLSGAVVVGDPWAASFEFAPGQTLFNDGTTSSFRVSNVEFGFGTGNDMIKYSNLPPSALFDDSITAFNDFGGPPFDEIQTQDFTLQQESGPPLPTEDVFFAADFFDADGDVIGSPINSFSDLLNVLEDPNFLNNLEANQILFEALDEFVVPVANEIVTPLEFSPSQFGEGVAILGTIDTIIVTRSQQAVGGEIIPIETTSLILAGAQSFSWMIPLVLSGIGIGLFVVSRKSKNSLV